MKKIFIQLLLLSILLLTGCHTYFRTEYTINPEKQETDSNIAEIKGILSEIAKVTYHGLYLKKTDTTKQKSVIANYEGAGSSLTAIKKGNTIIITLFQRSFVKPLPEYVAA